MDTATETATVDLRHLISTSLHAQIVKDRKQVFIIQLGDSPSLSTTTKKITFLVLVQPTLQLHLGSAIQPYGAGDQMHLEQCTLDKKAWKFVIISQRSRQCMYMIILIHTCGVGWWADWHGLTTCNTANATNYMTLLQAPSNGLSISQHWQRQPSMTLTDYCSTNFNDWWW